MDRIKVNKKNLAQCALYIFAGFLGGVVTILIWLWGCSVIGKPLNTDSISVVNTFIVFTTFIFTGIAVLLAVAGFLFTQQFAEAKESQLVIMTDTFSNHLVSNYKLAESCIDKLFELKDVQRYAQQKIEGHIQEVLLDMQRKSSDKAVVEAEKAHVLASMLQNGGEKE